MKKVLITGASSYIGDNVEKWLMQYPERYQVNVLDMIGDAWKEHDFCQYDVVYHVAGIAHADVGHVSDEVKNKYYQVNTELAVAVAKKAKEAGVGQFIFMSSMIVYGGLEHVTKDTQPQPANFYGDSKWQADCRIRELADTAFKVVVVRPPMIYGKGSKGNYPLLAKMARKLPVFPKVNNKGSMLYIENLCEFVKLMIDNEEDGVFFPQNEALVSTSTIVKEIAKMHGHAIWVSGIFAPAVWIGKCVPGKIGGMCKKAFGSSYYDLEMSQYKHNYVIRKFEESIKLTEEKEL